LFVWGELRQHLVQQKEKMKIPFDPPHQLSRLASLAARLPD